VSGLFDLTGQRHGTLTVTSRAPNRGKSTVWNVVCDCGTERQIDGSNLARRSGKCTCPRRARLTRDSTVHPVVWERAERIISVGSYTRIEVIDETTVVVR
jgi:hypothetical protein